MDQSLVPLAMIAVPIILWFLSELVPRIPGFAHALATGIASIFVGIIWCSVKVVLGTILGLCILGGGFSVLGFILIILLYVVIGGAEPGFRDVYEFIMTQLEFIADSAGIEFGQMKQQWRTMRSTKLQLFGAATDDSLRHSIHMSPAHPSTHVLATPQHHLYHSGAFTPAIKQPTTAIKQPVTAIKSKPKTFIPERRQRMRDGTYKVPDEPGFDINKPYCYFNEQDEPFLDEHFRPVSDFRKMKVLEL